MQKMSLFSAFAIQINFALASEIFIPAWGKLWPINYSGSPENENSASFWRLRPGKIISVRDNYA